jgi:predicted DNA-binding transcriptional regulator AlpA
MGSKLSNQEAPLRFLKLAEVINRLGISRSEAFRRIHCVPNFPKPIRMGVRCVVYSSAEVSEYQLSLLAQRDAKVAAP